MPNDPLTEPPASDAIAAALLVGEETEPYLLYPACACAYCREAVQMVASRFRNLYNGELHTCPLYEVKQVGRRYVRGEFTLLAPEVRHADD